MMTSKCAGCDQHNAVIYNYEDMYCHDCYNEESIETPKIIVQGGVVVEVTGLDKYEIIDLDIEEGELE